jgi:hypothetical protein
MVAVVYVTLWEVIGIISGVFFSMLFLVALARYLYEAYATDAHTHTRFSFAALDASEGKSECESEDNVGHSGRGSKTSTFRRVLEAVVERMAEWKEAVLVRVSGDASDETATQNIKKKKKKKTTKVKIKKEMSQLESELESELAEDGGADEDEETGSGLIVRKKYPEKEAHRPPPKTKTLYGGTNSKHVGNSYSASAPIPLESQEDEVEILLSNSLISSHGSDEMKESEMSTSFSGRTPRLHPSQQHL